MKINQLQWIRIWGAWCSCTFISMNSYWSLLIWLFPKIGIPQNGWFIMEIPIKMDDLGEKPTIFGNIHIVMHCIYTFDNFYLERPVLHRWQIVQQPREQVIASRVLKSRCRKPYLNQQRSGLTRPWKTREKRPKWIPNDPNSTIDSMRNCTRKNTSVGYVFWGVQVTFASKITGKLCVWVFGGMVQRPGIGFKTC